MSYDPFESLVKGLTPGYKDVLCVGAVSPSLVRYLADGVGAQVHVCDFDEQRLQLLQSEIQENAAVQYHNVLPQFEAGDLPEIGYHCSEPTHSSLALPSGITEILPGLLFEPVEVEALAFTDLFEKGNFSASEANLLILATNGYEASWLVKESALAALFSTVLIRSPRSNCFETVDTQGLAGDLAQSGLPAMSLPMGRAPYESIVIHQSPDWHAQRSELGALRSESEALQSKLSVLIEDGHAISERLAAVTSEAESEKAELNQRISSLESDIDALTETLQERDDAVANELRSEQELQAELSAKSEEAQAMSESLNAARSEAESEKVQLTQRISVLESDNAKSLKALNDSEAREVLLKKTVEAQQESVSRLQASRDDNDQKVVSLEKQNQELRYCQSLLDEEILKAEAQLELVKDVVLRDKAF